MQLISYSTNGQERSARIVVERGEEPHLGIDLRLAVEYFAHAQGLPAGEFPMTLVELFTLGRDANQLARDATDWIASQPKNWVEYKAAGMLFDFASAKLLAPIPRPGKVICIAGNFPLIPQAIKPEYPTVFLKPASGVIGSRQPIQIPPVAEAVVYEVELAVVIGKPAKNLSLEETQGVIAGYTIANDLGDQYLEKRTSQWVSGKMFDTFTPLGPVLITSDELLETNNLEISTRVNEHLVQKGNTAQMFFDIPFLVSYLSTLTTLAPGDVILTGSPKLLDGEPNPVCPLKHGDTIQVKIDDFPSLINPIIIEKQVV